METIINIKDPGYKNKVAKKPSEFLKEAPNPVVEATNAVSSIPLRDPPDAEDETVKKVGKKRLSPIMYSNGHRFRFYDIGVIHVQNALASFTQNMTRNKPDPQMFIEDGQPPIVADTNPAYLKALEVWQEEWDNIANLATNLAIYLGGVILLDGVPEDDDWLEEYRMVNEAMGVEIEKEALVEYVLNEDQKRKLLFVLSQILNDEVIMSDFQAWQNEGEKILDSRIITEEEASEFFRS
jgi:hypothetical protein